jgi:hypothetical protein
MLMVARFGSIAGRLSPSAKTKEATGRPMSSLVERYAMGLPNWQLLRRCWWSSVDYVPSSKLSGTIRAFSSAVHRRRRAAPWSVRPGDTSGFLPGIKHGVCHRLCSIAGASRDTWMPHDPSLRVRLSEGYKRPSGALLAAAAFRPEAE